jgi:hypothetical protein
MARAPRTTASKSGGGAKSPVKGRGSAKASSGGTAAPASKARSGSKSRSRSEAPVGTKAQRRASTANKAQRGTAQKRSAAKSQPRRKSEQTQSWGGALATMITSQLGRDILSDVLEAAAAALRKERPGQQTSTDARNAPDTTDSPVSVAAELAAGSAALASTAVNVLAGAVTDSALTALEGIAEGRER